MRLGPWLAILSALVISAPGQGLFVPGEVLIAWNREDSERRIAATRTVEREGFALAHRPFSAHAPERWRTPRGMTVATAVRRLNRLPGVRCAEPNWLRWPLGITPDDPLFPTNQWPLENPGGTITPQGGPPFEAREDADLDAPTAWMRTTGSRAVVVAIVDTGIDTDHPDLAANLWVNPGEIAGNGVDDDANGYVDDVHGYDFALNVASPEDTSGISHGTRVAGHIGMVGDNALGGAGVCWEVSLMPLRAVVGVGLGAIIEAIDYAAANGAGVLNASYGGFGFSALEREAYQRAAEAGVVVIAATGNDAVNMDQFPFYPATYDTEGMLAVGATTPFDVLAPFSNFGPNTAHLHAPGTPVYSTVRFPEGDPPGFAIQGGTSFAAPHVAGVAALLLSEHFSAEVIETTARLRAGADALTELADTALSAGRVNASTIWSEDAVAPSTVTDLRVRDVASLGARVTFTAPGDDGQAGPPALYDVRLRTEPLTEDNWFDAVRVWDVPLPALGGETVTLALARTQTGGLAPATTYHVAVRAVDEAGNWGDASNSCAFTTAALDVLLFDSFEADSGLWTAEFPWTRTMETLGYGGGYAYHDALNPYEPSQEFALTLNSPLDLTGIEDAELSFLTFQNFETGHTVIGDAGAVEVSTDGASWETVALIHSTATPFRRVNIPLARWADEPALRLRFRLFSDGDDQVGLGWWIDNVRVFHSRAPLRSTPDLIVESEGVGQTAPLLDTYEEVEGGGAWQVEAAKSAIPVLEASRARANPTSPERGAQAIFRPWIPVDGTYEVAITWGATANAASASVIVTHAEGADASRVTQDGSINADRWHALGTFRFAVGTEGHVTLDESTVTGPADAGVPGLLAADAVRWRLVDPSTRPEDNTGVTTR